MTNLEIFVEIMKDNFYFGSKVSHANMIEINEDGSVITIYNEDPTQVIGMCEIGTAAKALDLCCTARWSEFDNRLEVRVH